MSLSNLSTNSSFDSLPLFAKRSFLPQEIDLSQVVNVKKFYQQLIDRTPVTEQEFTKWMLDRGELESALDQLGSILYIRMTCQTDDESRAKAYQQFISEISPAVRPLDDQLNQKYIAHSKRIYGNTLPDIYHVYDREVQEEIKLFVQENVELFTKVELLSQEYQTITGAMMVEFQGKEQTLSQMSKYLNEPDREVREAAWKAMADRRLKDKDQLEDIFDRMLKIRHQIAVNAGCKNFCEYKFRSMHRFDYTPQDCKEYHASMKELLLPLWKDILTRRAKTMKLDRLRPWDTSVDALGRPSLKPFEHVDQLIEGCHQIFEKVDPVLGRQFKEMTRLNLLDLASRKGKAPGGYQSSLAEARKPFIFMNAVGVDSDVYTLLHEGGHAFHTSACENQEIADYRHGPMEFNEVASMAMELLGGEFLSTFYNAEDLKRSLIDHFESIIFVLIWVAIIDAFQHWIYENPQHTQEQRKEAWLKLQEEYSTGMVDWQGLEDQQAYAWHRQLHIFEVPFYYIEYGIAQLGALQVWQNAKQDWAKAIADYRKGLALGGSRPLPELYEQANIRFDFSKQTIGPLVVAVKSELDRLANS